MQLKRVCQGIVAVVIFLWLWTILPLQAQEERLTLRLSRDFGSAVGVQIRGTFSYHVTGPADLERVVFLLDGEPIGEDRDPPFRLQFRTERYETGLRTLSAIGYTSSGDVLQSNVLQREFMSSDQALNAIMWIIGPILLVSVAAAILAIWLNRRAQSQGTVGGLFGGAICQQCGRPFAIHFFAINLVTARLDRCPHCGKWQMVRRASPEALAAASEKNTAVSAPPSAPEKSLRNELDDSRFDDSR